MIKEWDYIKNLVNVIFRVLLEIIRKIYMIEIKRKRLYF